MTAEQFAYWLQGFSELNLGPPSEVQWKIVQDHLATVFTKVTPARQQDGTQVLRMSDLLKRTETKCENGRGSLIC